MQVDFKYLRALDFPELQYLDAGKVTKGNNRQRPFSCDYVFLVFKGTVTHYRSEEDRSQ